MKFMNTQKTLLLSCLVLSSLCSNSLLASNHHDSESNKSNGTGHCIYMADNPFAGEPYKACRTNVSEEFCMHYPEVGDGMVSILEPAYSEGDCPREESVGSCERGGWEEVYYQDSNQGPWA